MKPGVLLCTIISAGLLLGPARAADLPAPSFHHLHLNSVNPGAAIDFYVKEFPTTSKSTWGGFPALASPNHVLILFNKVAAPPPADPEATAYWHFGWYAVDERKSLALYKTHPEVTLAPLYTTDEGGSVLVNSDTWPGIGSVLGLTKTQIADAKAKGVQPAGGAGFAYMRGPDHALIEYAGNYPEERFNHVHMYQEDPFCAQLWYQAHLNATPRIVPGAPVRTQDDCKVPRGLERSWPALSKDGMFRAPTAGVSFGDVAMNWYMRQTETPLADTRGHLMDHVGLGVGDLDAWISKLKGEGVTFLKGPYRLGSTRAVMIQGPSREAIELVEVK